MKIFKAFISGCLVINIFILAVLFCGCKKNNTGNSLPAAAFTYASSRIAPVFVKFTNLSQPNPTGVDTYL